jgi:ABC-type glycerol-3-phosphate transport system substrate-binding protein
MKAITLVTVSALIILTIEACTPRQVKPSSESTGTTSHKIILSVLAGQSTSDAGIEEMINDFLRTRLPNVELEWERMDWGERFEAQMQAKFASGEVPDIMIGKAQDVATYVPTGNLAPAPASLVKLIDDAALPAVTVKGRVYGLPYNAFYQGVFYNKDIFKEYELTVPTTQNDLSVLIRKLTAERITPFAAHFEEDWFVGNIVMQFAIGEVFTRTPNWGDEFRSGKVSFASSAPFRRVFDYVKEIHDDSWPDAVAIGQAECDERFAKGQAAMYVTGTWTLQTINAVNPKMNVGVFPFPNQGGDTRLIFEPNMTFMTSSKTTHPDAVEKVLHSIFESRDLASEIFDYTKTSSMLKNIKPDVPLLIQPDIDHYHKIDKVTDVTRGNTQLIWSFQEQVAKKVQDWLRGKANLQSVLDYADQNRALSAP